MIGRQIAGSGGLVFVLECKMNMLPVPVTPSSAPPLAEVELEMALQINDIRAQGFADSVREAASRIGGHVLFDLPCPSGEGCQRVAAIVAAQDHEMQVLLVILVAFGVSVSTENASDSDHAFAGFALSHAALDEHLGNLDLDDDTEEEDDEA